MWKKFMMHRILLAVLIVGVTVVAVRTADSAETIARAVATELSARDFDKVTERFNGQMAAALSKERLAATWDQVTERIGAFKGVTAARNDTVQGDQRIVLTCEFEKTTAYLTVVIDTDSKIAGMTITPTPPAAP
jgi:Protein of unknown function (DUF3887)